VRIILLLLLLLVLLLLLLLLLAWKRALEKLTGPELVRPFYETRRFITAFTRARHLSLS
jgi:hypothetical protein